MSIARLLSPLALAGALMLAACGGPEFDPEDQIGPEPVLPEPKTYIFPPLKIAETIGWERGEKPIAPSGFVVTRFSEDLNSPRNVLALPNGDLLVVQGGSPGAAPITRPKDLAFRYFSKQAGPRVKPGNNLLLLRDEDGDGVAEGRGLLLGKLDSPYGIAWADDTLYIAETSRVMAYPYEPGQLRIDLGEARHITDLPAGEINHHWTKSIAISPEGDLLYASVGSNSNAGERGLQAEIGRALIFEIDLESGRKRPFATGLRNPNGLTFHPASNALWAVVNERDELGDNLVPDFLTSVQENAFYGWPWSYFGTNLDPRVKPERPDMVARAIAPDYALGSHVAPLGLAFGPEGLPSAYVGGAFIGERGSWNRSQFAGYRVSFVPFRDGRPAGKSKDFLTGFLTDDGKARGRPVGVAFGPDGALYVADDVGQIIWRVAPIGGSYDEESEG